MGMLEKKLSNPSAYSVKKNTPELWENLVDRINGAIVPADLNELEAWLDFRPLDLPAGWYSEVRELIDRRREELAEEDISKILLDKFDF